MAKAEVVLLGSAQDAGLPQAGCSCDRCLRARRDPSLARHPVSLAIVDHHSRKFWLIDATPALPAQLHHVLDRHPGFALAGVFLTHAHIGHYAGLIHLGKEAGNVSGLRLGASESLLRFLSGNQPWAAILEANCLSETLQPGVHVTLSEGLSLEALGVPHRGEFSDTMSFIVHSEGRSLWYCPDVDGWERLPLAQILDRVEHALLDGTFFSPDELPGRDLSQIPHPFARETARSAAGRRAQVWLIHLNHTNPLHDAGPERDELAVVGVNVGEQGQVWEL